ncbi:MAG: hypothetical protein Q4B40_04295 [Clostridia bacterium]|nr:hypothetical protein [Clostridia bacterium]
MRKGIIVNLKKFKLLDYVNINKIFIILSLLFTVGIFIGSTILSSNDLISDFAKKFFTNFIELHKATNFIKKLFFCFLRYLIILILYFLSGSGTLGVVLCPYIIIWQGIFLGSLISYVYGTYGISGIAFNAIILIPPMTIFAICSFFAARYSINFSLQIAKLTLPRSRPVNLFYDFKNYCNKYVILFLITLLCSVIEIVLNLLFFNFFSY